jgi:hypothetical protein
MYDQLLLLGVTELSVEEEELGKIDVRTTRPSWRVGMTLKNRK